MDKETVLGVAPLLCATIGVCGGLVAFCLHPEQAPAIKEAVGPLLLICGTAWQASRNMPKQPGA